MVEASENSSGIVKKAGVYVHDLLKKDLGKDMHYHDLPHSQDVVEVSQMLGDLRGLDSESMEILLLAAWFHDLGFIRTYEDHEEASADLARKFLKDHQYPEAKTEKVADLIINTQKGKPKSTDLDEILHDADIAHIGRKRFFRKAELLRVELENVLGEKYTELDWEKKQYEFLTKSDFITREAKAEFESRKAKNIKKQRASILKARKVTTRKKTGKDFGRGIDTLYRANYRNHINFSAIADGKANMMISINTILISVIVTFSGASLSVEGFTVERFRYTIPILVLLLSSLFSVVFAVLSARPKVTEKKVDMADVEENKISLLYFGNFLGIPKNDFIAYLSKLKQDQKRLYDSMSIDLYNLGIVLKEKYRLLTISYNIFMTGMTLCVLGFIFIFIYTNTR